MISMACGGVADRILQGEGDLATWYSPARRSVAGMISWSEGSVATWRYSLAHQGGVAAVVSMAGGDTATLRFSLAHQRGVAALVSAAEGDKATRHYFARRSKTDWCSWAEGDHLETSCCSSSTTPSLSLLQGEEEEGEEGDKEYDDYPGTAAAQMLTAIYTRSLLL